MHPIHTRWQAGAKPVYVTSSLEMELSQSARDGSGDVGGSAEGEEARGGYEVPLSPLAGSGRMQARHTRSCNLLAKLGLFCLF